MTPRPVIMIVDDDPAELAELLDSITRRFGGDYRVLPFLSPRKALDELERLKSIGEDVALILADQTMQEMPGIELLGSAHEIDRAAKRALLVAWGDRRGGRTILEGCAFDQLDNYILKPWAPPEVHLYPAISEFLAEWTRTYGPRLEVVRIVGEELSPRTHELRELFERNGIPYGFHEVGSEGAQKILDETGLKDAALPIVVLLDGRALVNPSNPEIADALGVTSIHGRRFDVVIVGAGPAGLAAAVYAASEGLRTAVIEREAIGGQAGTSSLIRNYLGFPRGISGAELAQRAYQQAWLFGAKYVFAREAVSLRSHGERRIVTLSDGIELSAKVVLICTGARYRRFGLPRLDHFTGAGVYYTSMGTDTRVIRGRDVYVVGGGNSAGQAVVYLAKNARKVTLLVRGDSLEKGMSNYLVQEIRRLPNVEVRLNTSVVDGEGDHALERITVRDGRTGTTETIPTNMLFVLIGAKPYTDWLAGTVQRDPKGFILTGRDVDLVEAHWPAPRAPMRFETSMPGVFAVGDVRFGSVKRVASAVGEGAIAVQFIHEYLEAPVVIREFQPQADLAPAQTGVRRDTEEISAPPS